MWWSAGGWIGSQLGATLWMLVAGIAASTRAPAAGLGVLALCAAANGVGLWLWRRRALAFHASVQTLLAVCCACGLLAVFLLDRAEAWLAIQRGGAVSASASYAIVAATYGGLMLLMRARFGRGAAAAERK
jgi:hypothetical protein